MKNEKIWCRLELHDGSYHYVYVHKKFAMVLCLKQGYEINIDSKDIPQNIKNEYGK
tara:strand:- start:448 stop:615 length:168 start_codon:yes stop_codon:yes gene_type:complete